MHGQPQPVRETIQNEPGVIVPKDHSATIGIDGHLRGQRNQVTNTAFLPRQCNRAAVRRRIFPEDDRARGQFRPTHRDGFLRNDRSPDRADIDIAA